MRVLLVTGPRGGHPWVERTLRALPYAPDLVILGGARGVDAQAEQVCVEEGWSHIVLYPFWAELGKKAGMERNKDMAQAALLASPAPLAIGFPWKQRSASPGTWGCLDYCGPRMLTIVVRENGMLERYL